MVAEKIRNYDVSHQKHVVEASRAPDDLTILPEFHHEAKNEANSTAGDEPVSNSSGESSNGRHDHAAVGEDDFLEKTKPGLLEPRPLEPLSQLCGELPTGSSVEYFHEPPRIIHARNLEGRYLDDFHSQVHEAFAPNMT